MKVEIYHAIVPNFGFDFIHPDPVWPEGFEHVATIQLQTIAACSGTKLDEAYRLSNTIDEPWYDGPAVTWRIRPELRSTSAGDIIKMDGKLYRCKVMTGWTEIS